MSKSIKWGIIIVPVLFIVVLFSCSKNEEPESQVSVYLHDAPASQFDKIKIHVKGVSIYSQASGGWVSLTVDSGNFDLLALDSSHPAFLGNIKLKGGDISQVRLEIDNQNNVTVNGIVHPLILDAADLDKLQIKIEQNVNGGSNYKLSIDFKASESIDSTGGVYKLKASLKIDVKSV